MFFLCYSVVMVCIDDEMFMCVCVLLHSVLLQQNTQLTVPVLDALSSLNLSSALLSEVQDSNTHAHATKIKISQ